MEKVCKTCTFDGSFAPVIVSRVLPIRKIFILHRVPADISNLVSKNEYFLSSIIVHFVFVNYFQTVKPNRNKIYG